MKTINSWFCVSVIKMMLYLLALVLSATTSAAESVLFSPVPYSKYYTAFGDINLGEVNTVFQSRDGFIWVGTDDGLIRFDGYDATRFSYDPQDAYSLPHNRIFGVEQDQQGNIWLASYGGGLIKFDPHTGRFSQASLKLPDDTQEPTLLLYRPAMDSNDILWITSNKRLMWYDTVANRRIPLPAPLLELPNRQVTSVIFDSKSNPWISTDYDGVFMFDGQQLHQFSTASPPQQRLLNNKIRVVFEDAEKVIWIGTAGGLHRYHPNDRHLTQLIPSQQPEIAEWYDDIYAIQDDIYGRLWLGSANRGIFSYDPKTNMFDTVTGQKDLSRNFRENTINQIFKDSNGSLWFAGKVGLTYLPSNALRFNYLTNAEGEFKVSDVKRAQTDKIFFLGEFSLYELQPNSLKAKPLVVDERMLYRFDQSKSGDWWVSVLGLGLQRYSPKTNQLSVLPNSLEAPTHKSIRLLREVNVDEQDQIWLLSNEDPPNSYGGLLRYDEQTLTSEWAAELGDTGVLDQLLRLDDNTVLVSSLREGLFAINIHSGQVSRWAIEKPSSPKQAGAIYRDSVGQIWIGTLNQGLAKYDVKTDTFRYFAITEGLLSNNINSIVEDNEHNLWLGSTVGLTRFNPQTETALKITKQDGLLFSNFFKRASVKRQDGKILMGSKSGLVQFDPMDFKQLNAAPRAFINDFRLFNQVVPLSTEERPTVLSRTIAFTDTLTLSAEDYVFSFGFSATEFQHPSQVQFAYRMLGLDDKWVYTDVNNRKASYTTLSAGDYVFEVKAANSDGVWSQHADQIKLTILPYWYLRWQAYLVYLLILLGAIYLYIRRQTAKLTYEAKLLESKVAQRTSELQQSRDELAKQSQTVSELLTQKQRLFASMSHEFRTPLTLILSPIDQMLKRFTEQTMVKELSLIKRNGRRLLRMVDQLLEFSKLEQHEQNNHEVVSLSQTVALVCASFETLVESKNLTLKVAQCPEVNLLVLPDSLNKILINLLSNSFKYTPSGGHIEVLFEREEQTVSIVVKDNGIGIAQQDQQVIFERFNRATHDHGEAIAGAGIGLALVKELIEANRGSIRVASELHVGSTFTVTLPLTEQQISQTKTAKPSKVVTELLELELDSVRQNPAEPTNTVQLEINDLGQQQSILIIDDNTDMRNLLQSALAESYYCIQADNGQVGLKIAMEQLPDLIISDIMMPVMDGYQLAQKLKENILTSHIPIVLLTAKGSVESRIKGLQLLVDDYLAKPFNIDELKLRIHNILTIRAIVAKQSAHYLDNMGSATSPENTEYTALEKIFIEQLNQQLEDNYSELEFNVKCLSDNMKLSERQLHRKIKAMFDVTIPELVRNYRLKKAADLLVAGHRASQVYYNVGFSSHSYFSSCFKAKFKVTPKAYQSRSAA